MRIIRLDRGVKSFVRDIPSIGFVCLSGRIFANVDVEQFFCCF